jgi:hypothetical protein
MLSVGCKHDHSASGVPIQSFQSVGYLAQKGCIHMIIEAFGNE